MSNLTDPIPVKVDQDTRKGLEQIADAQGLPLSTAARMAIKAGIPEVKRIFASMGADKSAPAEN